MNAPQEVFEEMKSIATQIWQTFDNQFGYVDEKLARVNSLENIGDNAMIFFRMFDVKRQDQFIKLAPLNVLNYINDNY